MTKPFKFKVCNGCVNHEFDPEQCIGCKNGSNFEPPETEDEPEEIDYQDFLTMIRNNIL